MTAKQRLATAARPARTVFRKEVGLAVNEAVGEAQSTVQSELAGLRRILSDDMDAANETTAVFGRLLARLSDRLDAIDARLASIDARLDGLLDTGGAPGPER